ncbi:hypothetical protein Q7P37_003102 [Cladosporium fusiforme]
MTPVTSLVALAARPHIQSLYTARFPSACIRHNKYFSNNASQETPRPATRLSARPDALSLASSPLRAAQPQPASSKRWRSNDSSYFQRWEPAAGAEPGFGYDVGQQKPVHQSLQSKVDIQIVDYSHDRLVVHKPDSATLDAFLKDNPKPAWSTCRWIHVNGIEPEVVGCLGTHKHLHPLALEDVLDKHTPTKVNWYENHCYLEMNMVKLMEPFSGGEGASKGVASRLHKANGPRSRSLASDKFGLSWEQVSAFLTADGTVITIFEHSGKDVFNPILARLKSPQTVVRSSNDPSMLLQAVIDTTVDLSLPISNAVAEIFDELERAVLYNPRIPQSKQLHVLRSGLTLLLNNTIAIGGLVKTLCDHRPVANLPDSPETPASERPSRLETAGTHISPTARIYFQDVQDHIQTLSNSTHMSIRSAENLSSLIFNSITASQNESVRKLTLVSSFFLPLTFLTSYFGMNFDPMPSVMEHSEVFFWFIATPVMCGTLMLLTVGPRWRGMLSRLRRGKTPRS